MNTAARAIDAAAIVFNLPYNVCPRFPQGTKWEVGMRSRYASCCWNMMTFAAALEYLRDQYANEVSATKNPRTAGDRYRASEFWGFIDGPGGRLEWSAIKDLVTGAQVTA